MKKTDVELAFASIKGAKEKEDYLKKHGVKFTYDSFQNLIIWCKDGVMELSPRASRR